MFQLTLLLFISHNYLFASSTICEDVQEKGLGSSFSVEELKSLSLLSSEVIMNCIVFLGKEQLSDEQSKVVWNALIQIHGSAEVIPEEILQHLGWISNGISPEHFANLSLSEVDTIEAFGKHSSFSADQSLNSAVFEQWSSKEIEDLSSYDLMTLRQILCSFNGSEILRIHPDAYKDAAHELGTLKNCSKEVLEGLAQLATSTLAFGNPKRWTSLQIAAIGCVVSGLPSIRVIPASAMEGFTKSTVSCLPPNVLQEMSEEQISNLSPSAASALNEKQLSTLHNLQKYALELAIKGTPENKKSNGVTLVFETCSLLKMFFLTLYLCYFFIGLTDC